MNKKLIRKMQTAAGGPLVNESTRVEKPIITTPKKINKTQLSDDNLWEKTDNSKANVYPNLRNDKYIQEFFLYDYAPRFKRLNSFASQNYVNAALNIYKNTPINIYNEDSNEGGYQNGGERRNFNSFFSRLINQSYIPSSIYLNEKFKMNRPTLVHELTHAFRLGHLGITGDARFSSVKRPIYSMINTEIGNEYSGSGYSNSEKNILNNTYNMNGYKIDYDPLWEKGTTNTEVRFRLWKQLYDKLGRRPSLEETDEYIRTYDGEKLLEMIREANAYGQTMYDNGMLINLVKNALINVAQNNNNNTYLLDDQTYYAKQGGMLKLKNGSGIHIKKKNRGKFTSYCGGKVTDACIRKAKASGNPTLVKRATFAANARKWKHKMGGILKGQHGLPPFIAGNEIENYYEKENNKAEAINNREREITKQYFSSTPTIENIWNGLKHLYKGYIDTKSPNYYHIGIVSTLPTSPVGRVTPQLVLLSAKLMETINNYWKNLGKLKIRLGGNGKYASGILTKPGTAPTTFNGLNINYITSPKGGNVTHKFYTDLGSEYILTKDGFARRVKSSHANTGGADAGLHEWNKGATRFLDSDELGWSYQAWTDRTKPLGFSEKDGIISLVTNDNGKWRYVMRSELRPNAVKNGTIKDGIVLSAYTTEPKVGKWMLEYGTNPTGEINWFHPGSQVAFIEGLKQGGIIKASDGSNTKNWWSKAADLIGNNKDLLQTGFNAFSSIGNIGNASKALNSFDDETQAGLNAINGNIDLYTNMYAPYFLNNNPDVQSSTIDLINKAFTYSKNIINLKKKEYLLNRTQSKLLYQNLYQLSINNFSSLLSDFGLQAFLNFFPKANKTIDLKPVQGVSITPQESLKMNIPTLPSEFNFGNK